MSLNGSHWAALEATLHDEADSHHIVSKTFGIAAKCLIPSFGPIYPYLFCITRGRLRTES
jgi:hypothetical protein